MSIPSVRFQLYRSSIILGKRAGNCDSLACSHRMPWMIFPPAYLPILLHYPMGLVRCPIIDRTSLLQGTVMEIQAIYRSTFVPCKFVAICSLSVASHMISWCSLYVYVSVDWQLWLFLARWLLRKEWWTKEVALPLIYVGLLQVVIDTIQHLSCLVRHLTNPIFCLNIKISRDIN